MNYFIYCLKNYVNFNGRGSRKEYWMFFLFHVVFSLIFAGLDNVLGTTFHFEFPGSPAINFPFGYLFLAYGLLMFFPSLAAAIRRLHDIGKSGWYYCFSLIPYVGVFILFFFLAKKGQEEENEYGSVPSE